MASFGHTLVADLSDREALARVVKVALEKGVAALPVASAPPVSGPAMLQLRIGGVPACVLAAEAAGGRGPQGWPLRLAPLDPTHVAELEAIVAELPPSLAPISNSASAIFDSKPPLPSAPHTVFDPPRADTIDEAPPPEPTERGGGDDWKKTDPSATELRDAVREILRGAEPEHPADDGSISVVFSDEITSSQPRVRPPMPPALTPTEPFPPQDLRELNRQKALELVVTEDSGTLPSSQGGARSLASTSMRGPRTQRRQFPPVGAGRIIGSKYRIEGQIGSGAVGAVYRASHGDLGRQVAIKILHPHCRADPHLLAAFRAEARAASNLDHANVTVVHDFGEEPDGIVYIVMEYLPGATLQSVIDETKRLSPNRAIAIMLQVCAALAAAHERGIVHRDVKPDNIMLVQSRDDEGFPREVAKVCDFGIAALAGPGLTVQGDGELTAGTPEYMAPEQAQGRSDPRTDVYACGVVLYEMLSGLPPFLGATPQEILMRHAKEIPRRLAEIVAVDARLEALVMRALEKPAERRFQSMRDLRAALKKLAPAG